MDIYGLVTDDHKHTLCKQNLNTTWNPLGDQISRHDRFRSMFDKMVFGENQNLLSILDLEVMIWECLKNDIGFTSISGHCNWEHDD